MHAFLETVSFHFGVAVSGAGRTDGAGWTAACSGPHCGWVARALGLDSLLERPGSRRIETNATSGYSVLLWDITRDQRRLSLSPELTHTRTCTHLCSVLCFLSVPCPPQLLNFLS